MRAKNSCITKRNFKKQGSNKVVAEISLKFLVNTDILLLY